jgi:hypothetical protein
MTICNVFGIIFYIQKPGNPYDKRYIKVLEIKKCDINNTKTVIPVIPKPWYQ